VFFILLSPIMWFCHTLFLAGLPFGTVIGWIGQVRDDHTVPWSVALKAALAAHGAGPCRSASWPPPIRLRPSMPSS
jgi:membrane glycosyltransferase